MLPNLRVCCSRIVSSAPNIRSVSTTAVCNGRRNFRKFPIVNKRGVWEHAKLPKELLENEFDYPVAVDQTKTRYPGVYFGNKFVHVKEMEPELVVPDNFENSSLKPYVSYRTEEIEQSEFNAEKLFNATYGKDIVLKFRKDEAIPESLTEYDAAKQLAAKHEAQKTGADLFDHTSYFGSIDSVWKFK